MGAKRTGGAGVKTVRGRCPVTGRAIVVRILSLEEAQEQKQRDKAPPSNVIRMPVGGDKKSRRTRSGVYDRALTSHKRALDAALKLWELENL